jgi:hypothetical protein
MEPFRFDQVRYLAAKRTVDDRALNRHVWASLLEASAARPGEADRPFQIVELGAGIGTMVERLIDWGLFAALADADADARAGPTTITMDLVDNEAGSVATARSRLPEAARARGWAVTAPPEGSRPSAAGIRLSGDGVVLDVYLHEASVYDFLAGRPGGDSDLVLAHAFLDLFDLRDVLPPVLGLLRPGGLGWFTITFDGATILEPELEGSVERLIESIYHESMDERVTAGRRSGDARAGRHLFGVLSELGAEVVDMGSSDWVVFPRAGAYPGDESYFLRCILSQIGMAVAADDRVTSEALDGWLRRRDEQVGRGELVYIAHQIDVLGRRASTPDAGGSREGS